MQLSVGDTGTVDLPEVKARSEVRLSGIRCIHTHPSDENSEQQIEAVVKVMAELHAEDKPTLYVCSNKIDRLGERGCVSRLLHGREGIAISAQTGENMELLTARIESFFAERYVDMTLLIPYEKGALVTALHDLNGVRTTQYEETGTRVEAHIPMSAREQFLPYVCTE